MEITGAQRQIDDIYWWYTATTKWTHENANKCNKIPTVKKTSSIRRMAECHPHIEYFSVRENCSSHPIIDGNTWHLRITPCYYQQNRGHRAQSRIHRPTSCGIITINTERDLHRFIHLLLYWPSVLTIYVLTKQLYLNNSACSSKQNQINISLHWSIWDKYTLLRATQLQENNSNNRIKQKIKTV